jgi:hypothetical protein
MKRWGDLMSGAGAVAFSLLSCALCPLCLPIYAAAFLGMVGLELANLHTFFLPAILLFAGLSLGFMAYQIRTHHGKWAPFIVALVAVFGMLGADFYDIDPLRYISLFLFMGSLIWNKKRLLHKKGNTCC